MDKAEILGFIQNFKGSKDVFLNGCCYWFAFILQERFGGNMMYEPVENHFVQEIGRRLYDVSGDVTEEYTSEHLMFWDDMESYDASLYQRLLRDCVRKEECPYE